MTERFIYPATLTSDQEGHLTVAFRDLPEALTEGADHAEALEEARDCLEEAIAYRIVANEAIPEPSARGRDEVAVSLPAQMAAKAALYLAAREAGISKVELANRLGCDEKEVRRMLDPRHPTKLPRIEAALAALGKRLVVQVQAA
ncbi:type II toxin-antitoxin system HicB family antitoxin [Endothiovibrio diazotrophicus]